MQIQFSYIQFSKGVKNKKIYHLNTTLKSAHISTDFVQCPGPGDSLMTPFNFLNTLDLKAGVDVYFKC